jgi:benzoyl-CoA reductase/2-hydroxyglutaryl-CoA dehydratase subunit BcrC/BadD/HgdB
MENPKFKNRYLNDLIIENGDCYTIKPQYETKVAHPSQVVVFAIPADGDLLSELKDIDPKLIFETTKGQPIKIIENSIITTSADFYGSYEKFRNFYDKTDDKIKEFWMAYSSSKKQLKQQGKQQSLPRPKRK